MEQKECSETLATKLHTPENIPQKNIWHSENSESLKSRIVQTSFIVFLPSLLLFICPLPYTLSAIFLTASFLISQISLSPFRKLSPCVSYSVLDITCWHSFTPPFIPPPSQFVISKNDTFALLSHPSKPELYLNVEIVMHEWNLQEWPTEYQSWLNQMWMNQ
jgi:hypothetical protein